ncbi:MAG: BatA domain-containing protein [Candidatus Omnitrophica bacterium]|nr:BatA domain-containing protein [Candidatus Omnitrophota bacterium]
MSFLSPWALLWLGSIPVLLWIWRFAATHRQISIPSLVPFERLLRRPPRRRTRLVVNTLFWLQLAALILLVLALVQPAIVQPRPKTILAVLDTSASMAGRLRGPSRFELAKQQLARRIARKAPRDQYFIVSTAPVTAVTPEPSGESARLGQAVDAVRVGEMTGNVATAVQIGQALLGGRADRILVVTDEARPADVPAGVEVLTVGEPLANTAIVGLESERPLCGIAAPHLMVTVENFSAAACRIQLSVRQDGRPLAEPVSKELAPRERSSVPLAIPETFEGWLEVILEAPEDALAVDNRAHILIRSSAVLPVAVVSEHAPFRRVIGEWLSACEALTWTDGPLADAQAPHLVVTDGQSAPDGGAVGILRLLPSLASQGAAFAHWVVAGDHAIGAYLPSVEPVVASLPAALKTAPAGEPVLWGLVKGRRVPIVLAGEEVGRRIVSFSIDPVASPSSIPVLVTFFNSLRWLMGQTDMVRTGEPIILASLEPGPVTVHRPNGTIERFSHPGGTFRYDAATAAGRYRFLHGRREEIRAVNFLDPLESNLLERSSTWRPVSSAPADSRDEPRSQHPLTNFLIALILGLLMAEWWLYTTKKR